ncbi:hypothetical protein [Baaleninema simplex]|nr:hypothetical protein [Baaleninema simplex]
MFDDLHPRSRRTVNSKRFLQSDRDRQQTNCLNFLSFKELTRYFGLKYS